jgi:ribonuclease BN (tRNA processing enzyme)
MADAPADGLRLTVIGSAPAWSLQACRPSSCYLVELGEEALVLDMGQGALGALAQHRRPETVSAVVVSHLHPDHHVDLVALRHYLKFGVQGPSTVRLHAPPDLRARYDALLGEHGFLASLPGDDVYEGTWDVGAFRVEARRVTHAPNAFAFRVSAAAAPDGTGLVYSGDCGRWQDLVPLLQATDTFLCEAFWGAVPAEADEMHLPAGDAAMAAREGRAGHLVLTHIADSQDPQAVLAEADRVFDGPVSLAQPGLTIQIG